VTQAVSGGRHDGFKYFRSEARAPPCPVLCGELSRLLSLSLDPLFLSPSFLSVLAFLSSSPLVSLSRCLQAPRSGRCRCKCDITERMRRAEVGAERGQRRRMQGERGHLHNDEARFVDLYRRSYAHLFRGVPRIYHGK